MQGCTARFAHEGRDSGAIRARALEGRTGELPADHGLASSAWTTGVGRSRGRLAQSLGASRQSVILLRRHYRLTILHYCYSNKPGAVSLNKSHLAPASRYGAGQGSHVPIDPVCHPCITGDARRFALKFCQDRSDVPQVRRVGYGGGSTDRSTRGPLETGHPCKEMMRPYCGRTPRQSSLERG